MLFCRTRKNVLLVIIVLLFLISSLMTSYISVNLAYNSSANVLINKILENKACFSFDSFVREFLSIFCLFSLTIVFCFVQVKVVSKTAINVSQSKEFKIVSKDRNNCNDFKEGILQLRI